MPADMAPSALIDVRGLTREYRHKTLFRGSQYSMAVDHVDIRIDEGSVTGIAGASGSGKSTLARCMAGLDAPTRGIVLYRGRNIRLPGSTPGRHKAQLVWQDPALTLNPRFTAARAVAEPLFIAKDGTRREQRKT